MKKELTKEEFIKYVQKYGITLAKTTKRNRSIPTGTDLYFASTNDGRNLSTFDEETNYQNKEFGYGFDYEWHLVWDNYKGNFIVLDYKETGFLADEYEWLDIGQEVKLHEIVLNSLNIPGMTNESRFFVHSVDKDRGCYFIRHHQRIYPHVISPLYIRPHTPEEVEEMTLEEVCKELGREIKIKK